MGTQAELTIAAALSEGLGPLPKPEAAEIKWSYRVHTTERIDELRTTEYADPCEGIVLVLDYVAFREGDQWRLSGEARRRPATGPDDKGKIITTEGRKVGEVVRDRRDGVIEMIVNADDSEWEQPDITWGGLPDAF